MSRISCLAALVEEEADEAEPGPEDGGAGVAASLAGASPLPGVAAGFAAPLAVRARFRAAGAATAAAGAMGTAGATGAAGAMGTAGAGPLEAIAASVAARLALRRRQLLSRGRFARPAELPAASSPAVLPEGSSSSGGAARFPATAQGRESCGPSDGATPWLS